VSIEILDYDEIAMLDGLPVEEARPPLRWEALQMLHNHALTVANHPQTAATSDRLVRLSHAAWTVATADGVPLVH
jgi:hypothetical protein